ncbi:MAG: DUF6316 family protein [Pseudomonadota bacterium]
MALSSSNAADYDSSASNCATYSNSNKQPVVIYKRSNRFFRKAGTWFYQTREGVDMGPFSDKAEAQMALVYFIERTEWPTAKQLRTFISDRSS